MRAARFLRSIPVLLALAVAVHATPAQADDAAEAKHAQGTALTKSGNYEGARMKFLEALSMRPMSKTFLNLCVVEQHLGLEPEAVAHCKQFLASDAAPALKKSLLRRICGSARAARVTRQGRERGRFSRVRMSENRRLFES